MKENLSFGIKRRKVGASHVGGQKFSMSLNDHVFPSKRRMTDREAMTSGTPIEFFAQCRAFSSRRSRMQPDDPVSLSEDWGVPPRIWHEEWSQASGGEAQRAMLAIAVSLKPDILLLDEPTSYPPTL